GGALSAFFLAPVLEQPGLRVHYEQIDRAAAERTAAEVRAISADIDARLGIPPPEPIDVHLAENPAAFAREVDRLAAGAVVPEWALAVALPGASAVVIRAERLD